MSVQGVIFLLCIFVACGGAFACAVKQSLIGALAFLVAALFILGYAWPVLSA